MASQPARNRLASSPAAKPKQPLRPRAVEASDLDAPDDLDLRLVPPSMREKVDPAVVIASLNAQIEEIRTGRAVLIDGDEFFAEWDEELKRLGA